MSQLEYCQEKDDRVWPQCKSLVFYYQRLAGRIKLDFPNCGYRMMQGHLLRQGHRIPHARIRDCLHRIDMEGVAIRWATTVQRRKYTVSSPQSLWHIDGNHKLIRLAVVSFIIHDGGKKGKSLYCFLWGGGGGGGGGVIFCLCWLGSLTRSLTRRHWSAVHVASTGQR